MRAMRKNGTLSNGNREIQIWFSAKLFCNNKLKTGNFNLLFGWPCIMDGNYFVVIAGRTCMYLNLWLVLYPCICISAGVKFEQINLGTKPVFKPRIPSRTIEQFWEQVNASRTPTNYEIHFEQNPIHTYIYWIQKTIEERNQLLFRIFTIYTYVCFSLYPSKLIWFLASSCFFAYSITIIMDSFPFDFLSVWNVSIFFWIFLQVLCVLPQLNVTAAKVQVPCRYKTASWLGKNSKKSKRKSKRV